MFSSQFKAIQVKIPNVIKISNSDRLYHLKYYLML